MLGNDTLYNPFNTAIKRKAISRPLRELINLGYFSLGDKVLDYGCGFGCDGNYLKLLLDRDKVFLYDEYNSVYKDISLLERFYDKVVCFYVFNVISSLVEHERVLNLLKSLGKELFIAVRSDEIKSAKSTWEWDDNARGYWTTRNTFQRFYDEDMIRELFGEVEYIVNGKDYKLFKITVDKKEECGNMDEKKQVRSVCWYCGAINKQVWSCDYSYEEVYGEGEGIVTLLHCVNCGCDIEYIKRFDGEEIN